MPGMQMALGVFTLALLMGCAGRSVSQSPADGDRPKCPKCDPVKVIPIVYGYPTAKAVEARDRGEIELPGCSVFDDAPGWRCNSCGDAFGKIPTRKASDGR